MLGTETRIEILGGLRVRDGERLYTDFARKKATALLGLLALRPKQTHTREALADALWPEVEPELGRKRLRQTLQWLRQRTDGASVPSRTSSATDRIRSCRR